GWIDDYDPDWSPNTTDAQGRRYRFGWQPRIAQWNLLRLAHALSPLFADTAPLQAGLDRYVASCQAAEHATIAAKLGLSACREEGVARMSEPYGWLHGAEVDMSLFFRALAEVDMAAAARDPAPLDAAFYDPGKREAALPALREWLARLAARVREDGRDHDS